VSAAAPVETRLKIVVALLAVYLIWGSTFLVLRFALESFPPFLLGGLRFGLAGATLFVVMRLRGAATPPARAWLGALLIGTFLFGLGNGLVAVAEQTISSGAAAIVLATTSLWAVLFAALSGRSRPTASELLGLALGLVGVLFLQRGGALSGSASGLTSLLLAPMAWAFGSVIAPRVALPRGGMSAALQMLMGGAAMLLISAGRQEEMRPLTPLAGYAFVYLVLVGSLVAFSAYHFLLQATRPALATSYAFVNPAIALLLGAWFGNEPLTVDHLWACGVTGLAVVSVLRAKVQKQGLA
jgi:drug/metabolite transporter (DMT)-like permease